MGKLTLRQAAEWCGGVVEEKYADVEFLGAANDTRVMQPGQLFIALQGARDGHDFIKKAMDRGAAAALCSRKVGDNPAQSGRESHEERRANVLGVYEPVQPERFAGKRLLLIDDIRTTGATLAECVRVLKEAGAKEVLCLTLAAAEEKK